MRIVGVVKNSRNAEKIKGAKIKLIVDNIELASVFSDKNGIFEYGTDTDFTGRNLKLKIEKEGFKSKSLSREIKSEVQDEEFDIKLTQKEEKTKIKLDKDPEIIKPESSVDIGIGKEGIKIGISSLSIPAKIAIGIIAIATIASFALPIIEKMSEKTSLSISPDPLSFNIGDVNANETISQSFSISNPGKETLHWKVSADKPWVNIKPTSGVDSGTISIDVNTAGLKQGSYAGIISIISDHGEKSGTISFNIPQIPVSSQSPILKVSKKTLSLESGSVGRDTNVDTLQISNAGSGTLDWQAKADKPWIDLSKTIGTNEGSIIITMNSAGLVPGKHIGTIIIASNGGTESVIIEFNIAAPMPTTTAVTTPAVTPTPTLSITANPTIVTAGTATSLTFTVTSNSTVVSGATVALSGSATGTGTTDASGSAVISVNAATAGTITATASKTGYTSGTTTVTANLPQTQEVINPEDCIPYDPNNLEIVDGGAIGWRLIEGSMYIEILDNQNDAEKALELAKRHTNQCFIGRDNTRPDRRSYIVEYWTGDSGITTTMASEDCIPYNPKNLQILNEGTSGWLLTDGFSRMVILDNEIDAKNALILAKRNTNQCFIGRDNTRSDRLSYIVDYWK